MQLSSYHSVRKVNDYLGIYMIININYISELGEWLILHERTVLSRRGAPLRPECARCSRDHLAADWVRSKLPPQYVPVSPSPVSREASRNLWRSVGPSTEN